MILIKIIRGFIRVKYDTDTGTIKIVKTDPSTNVETILATYAVGGNISPITSIGTNNPTGIIAMGDQSKAVQSNTIAIGTDAHAGNVGGYDDTNGRIAIGTKTVASGDRSIALGNQSTTNKGSYNIVQGDDSIGIGTSTSVFGYSGVSIGRRNIIGVPDPSLIDSSSGKLTTKSKARYKEAKPDKEAYPGGNSVIVGAYNVAYGSRSSIIGTYSRAMGSNSVAIGSGVQSLSDGAIAIGKGSGYEFEDGSRFKNGEDVTGDYYGRDWELPPEYRVLKQVLSNDINGDKQYKKTSSGRTGYKYENGGILPKYNNYGAGSSDPGGFIVEGKNALGIGTYTQVRGDSAIGLATGEMTADLSEKDKSQYARDMRKIMDMEEVLYEAKEKLKAEANNGDKEALESAVNAAEGSLAAAKKDFRKNYLSKYSFVEGEGALGVGRQILAQGNRSMAVGDYAKAISNDAIAYGGQTLANGTNSMAMGGKAHVGTEKDAFANSMAIGSHTNVQAGNAVALGAFSQVTGTNSLALGFGTQSSTDSNSITYNSVSGHDSTLIGSYGNIAGNNSILIGSSGSIANDRVVGLGNNINIKAADQNDQENNTAGSVFLGDHAGYVKDSKRARSLGEVTLVGSEEKKELTESLSSTKGALRDYTKDFIYIYMLENQDDGTKIGAPIAVRSDFAGGDSTVGVVSVGSTYEQTFENLDKIKEHHKKVGSLITVPVEVTVQVTKNGISLGEQKQTRYFAADATQEQINSDSTLSDEDKKKVWNTIQESRKKADTKYTVFETRRIQNVAPGLIGSNSTDAINGSQLFATNQMLGNLVGSLKKTFGDNVTITEDGQIKVSGGTLGWIAKAKAADGSNGTVNYQVGKDDKITKDDLEKKGSAIEAADQLVFQAGKNIGLVQTPDTLTISTIDTPSFKSVELRGDEKTDDGKKVTEVTKIDSSGMKVVTETSTPASDGSTTPPTVTEKVSTTVGKDGVSTDGSVKVTNGKDGDQAKEFVTIDKGTDGSGTDKEYGKIGLDGKNGSNATITVDRGTSSLDDTKNIGTDPNQDISKDNPAKMDRITYTTKNKDGKDVITHEVATMDDGLFFSGDSADGKNGNMKNTFGRKLSEEAKIVGGVTTPANLTDNNIGVVSNGSDTLTIKLAKQLTGLDSATYTSPTTKTDDGDATSTMKVDGNGIRFVGDNNAVKTDAPSLTTDGIDGGNKQITNIGSGLKNGDTTISISDLKDPNKVPPTSPVLNNAVNVGDLKNIIDTGFKLNTSGQGTAGATTVRIGDTIKVVDGANTKVSAIDDSTTGTYTFHIDVTGMPISYTDNQGNALTKIGDKYYKNTDIENGKPTTNATEVPADEVTNNIKVINKDGTTNNQGTISNVKSVFDSNIGNGADTGSNVDEIKDGSVISNTGSNKFINDLTKLNDQVDPKATNTEAEKIRAKKDEEKLNSVSTVRDLQKVALTPLFFEGDTAESATTKNAFGRKLSEKAKIVGGQKDVNQLTDNNIGVVSNGTDTLTIKLAKNLVNLTSVETGSGDNKTKMTENGITTTVKDGDTFKVTTTTPNGLATTEVKLDSDDKPTGESTTTMVTTDGVTITTQTPPDPDRNKPASTTETKLSKDGLATDGTIKVTGDNAKDLVTTDAPVSVSKVGDTYQLADGTKLVKVGDKFYKPSQLVDPNADQPQVKPEEVAKDWTVNDSISLVNKDGSNNAPTTLKNVGSGLKDANGNSTTLDQAVGSNAVNVDDLRTLGKAATTEVTGTGAAEVTKVTGANGQNIYNVHVDKLMTVKPVDPKANITRGGDGKYYNKDDIAGKTFVSDGNGGGSWYNASDVDAKTGKPLKGKTPLADQPIALEQSKLKNSVVNPNGDGATIVDNVKSGIGGEAGNGIQNGTTIDGTTGNNTFIKNLDKVGGTGEGAIDKTTVVNAGDLKNLADTPLFFSGDAADGKNGNVKNTFGRKLSEEAKILGGQKDVTKLTDNNIGVVSNGTDTLTIKLAKDLTDLHSVTTTDDKGNTTQINGKGLATTADDGKGNIKITTVTSDGITIVTTDKDGNNNVSLTNKGLDNGHHQIINVKSGLLDRQGNPVTLKNASGDILNNAVNVKDLRDVVQGLTDSGEGGGFGLTGNNGEVRKSLGETITLKGGIANKLENGIDMNKPEKATTDKNTYIDVKTSKNGSEKIMVVEIAKDLTDLNSAEFTDQKGNTTKMKGDGIYIDKNGDGNADISLTSEGLNNGGNKITNVADGTEDTDAVNVSQLNKLKQEIKQNIGDEINELNAYAPVVYTDKNGNRVIRKGNKFVKKNDETVEILPQDIRLSLVNADGKTTNPSTLQNVAKGVNNTDAVNVEQLKEATEKPLTFNGDAGSSSAKLGETVAIKGGANSNDLTDNNIGVIADSTTKTLNVKLSKKLQGLESAEFVDNNGNTTHITGDGMHISGGNGSNVSLTSQGLNNGGNRITNVAPGVEATDAVNVSQLNQVGAALHNRINNVAKGAYGGVASAGAMASLPQTYLPGKSMVAAGASHYRGESAVALGTSRISDNGKIILKLNASHNTSGNTMVGAGVGYQF